MSGSICRCGRPLHPSSAALCERCRHTLEIAIVNVGFYRADLATLRTGQVRIGNSTSTTGKAESHLGMDARFGKAGPGERARAEARDVITRWVGHCLEHVPAVDVQGPVCGGPCLHTSCALVRRSRRPATRPPHGDAPAGAGPELVITAGCRYLLGWSDWLRNDDDGPKALDELTAIERRLAQLVDRPADRWYAGVCSAPISTDDDGDVLVECDVHLYAKADAGDVTCPGCGTVYPVRERRDWLLAAAESTQLSASECARAITVLGEHEGGASRLAGRIRQWAARDRFSMADKAVAQVDGRPVVTYRLGAVLDLLASDTREGSGKLTA